MVANDIRLRISPPQADGSVKATFIVDRNLNPTNVCVTDWYAELLQDLKQRYPQVWIHGMSPPEITHVAKMEERPVQDVLTDLQAAGLQSIPGGGAEILVESVRRVIAPKKATTDEWLEVMRQWGLMGGKGTATMMFGHDDTPMTDKFGLDRSKKKPTKVVSQVKA